MVRNYEVPTVARYRPLINKVTIGSLLNYIIYVNNEMNYCVGFFYTIVGRGDRDCASSASKIGASFDSSFI